MVHRAGMRVHLRAKPVLRFCLVVLFGWPLLSSAAVETLSLDKSLVKELGHGRFEIGKVHLNQKERTVTIPGSVNMSEGTVEYFLVHKSGKTHESVLRTEAEPYHIQVAMLLIGAKGKGTNDFPADTNRKPPGDPIKVEVTWKSGEKSMRMRAEDLVWDKAAKG